MKVDLKINYLELENIAENVGKYKKAIEDINDAIENLDKVIQKQKSKSTKKLESKISNKKTKRSDLIDELDDIQKIIKDYCEDMRNLVNCKSEGTITRVDQFDIQFNIWQIAGDLTTFIGQMTMAPVEPPTPISVGPSNENNQRKMKANYNKLLSFHRSHIVPTYRLVDDYIDRLNKIYDKNIAPYENLDDDYESKMASIYHRGKSWTQIAEDWLFDHKGEIVAFCKSFAIAFLTTCTLIVIATAISVSAPVVFTVFGILVAAGQCTISCIPKSAFEAKWLKGIKDSSDSYVDGLNEKWKALSDRGIYGVLECIGQDIGDASQTGKGLATITGSITGMIAGSFAEDNLSLKVKKVKAAKAKAKSLKISETKEPELKNVEVEKPNVNTLIPKDVKDIIEKVENGTIKLVKNIQKGNYGEMKMDVYFAKRGYKRISLDRVTSIDAPTHHGIDGVYYNPEGKPPYVIAEAKFSSTGIPRLSKLRDGTRQMSEKWITKPSKRGLSRLDQAVGKEKALDILTKDYKSVLVTIDKTGDVKTCILDANGKVIK
ncbi:hypothetical protein [Lachnobacterium bovis]|uniref:hypothetical protein n=1 Tax=Lachnobacterium bovis TaxID=140626 RepID=UPI00068C76DC|nr:hypothetical protein [Lachnobacterium bovis]